MAGAKSRTTESRAESEERYAREREVSMKTIATPVVIFSDTCHVFPVLSLLDRHYQKLHQVQHRDRIEGEQKR